MTCEVSLPVFLQKSLFVSSLILSTSVGAFAEASPAPSAPSAPPAAVTVPAQIPAPTKSVATSAPVATKPAPFGGHLPIIDLTPELTYADPGATQGTIGGGLPGVVNGKFNLSGSFTIPIAKGLSASYDRVTGSFLNTTFGRITGPDGKYAEVGSLRRRMEVERVDYSIGKTGLALEAGSEYNRFECCLNLEFHDAFAAIVYGTPGIKALHGTKFVFIEKGSTSAHKAPPGDSGLDVNKREYGLSNIAVAIVPIDPHFYATETYFNGAYDFFEQAPYPFRFNVFIEGANFVINPNATVALNFTNLTQQRQAAPFGNNNAIHFVSYFAQLKLHFDLNKIFAPK